MAFYNGGEGAGASQKWRHVQFIETPGGRAPIEEWTDGVRFDRMDEPTLHPAMEHLHIVYPLGRLRDVPYPPSEEEASQLVDALAPAFMKTLDLGLEAVRHGDGNKDGGWNLIMTLDHIHLIPRSSPTFDVGAPHNPIELNSLGYAGMMLVRSDEEEKLLMESVKEGGLMSVLKACGVPRKWGEDAHSALRAHIAGEGNLAQADDIKSE